MTLANTSKYSRVELPEDAEARALRVLRLADEGEYVPAEHVAARVGCARTYVSTVIAALRAKGWEIDRRQGFAGGYRLLGRRRSK